ncbi:MAG: L-histidine N(alpha)-methyltransferase [Sphingobium sp.]
MDLDTSPLASAQDTGADAAFRADVLMGLRQAQKAVPARWLYDLTGSELFEEITRLPEYYPTRTERGLLSRHGSEVAKLTGKGRAVVEFGSGSSAKTPLLLSEVDPAVYVPIDISGEFLDQSAAQLRESFPGLPILQVEADFMSPVQLPTRVKRLDILGFFPGSTIGNLVPRTAIDLLRTMRQTLGPRSQLLIGMDRVKDIGRLQAAYDDRQGVTAQFNLNLLHRINREIGGDIPVGQFRHRALWNAEWSRIEMHLEAQDEVAFTISGEAFSMAQGETIHTENSHKYTSGQARLLLQSGGWTPRRLWMDEAEDFMLLLAEATEYRSAP